MFTFDRFDARRIAVSAAGALVFSALCIGSAVAPAQAAVESPATIAAWQANAVRRLDKTMATVPTDVRRFAVRDARIDVTVSRNGRVSAATVAQSSGSRVVDAALLRRAATMKLAPLPTLRGDAAQAVQLRIALVDGRQAPLPAATPVRYAGQ